MWCAAATLAFTTNPIDWSTVVGSTVIVLVAVYVLLLYFSPSRRKGMAVVASELGLQFFPVLSADQMGTRGASFVYGGIAGARNCMRGMIKGRETVIFDQNTWEPVS
jgi:hypothetical protein